MIEDKIIYEFAEKLNQKSDKNVLIAVHKKLIKSGYKIQAKYKGLGFDIKYSIKSRKPIVEIFNKKNRNSNFEMHIRPFYVA